MDDRTNGTIAAEAIIEALVGGPEPTSFADRRITPAEARGILDRIRAAGFVVMSIGDAISAPTVVRPLRIAGNDTLDVLAIRRPDGSIDILSAPLERLDWRADLACKLAEAWGAGDSFTPPEVIVNRACDTVALLRNQFAARSWLYDHPTYDEVADKIDEQEQALVRDLLGGGTE